MLARKYKIVIALIIFLFAFGCAGMTAKQQYLTTLETFTHNITLYNQAYAAADDATKAEWKRDVDPLILDANEALDAWGVAIGSSDVTAKRTAWITAKNILLRELIRIGVIQEGGQ